LSGSSGTADRGAPRTLSATRSSAAARFASPRSLILVAVLLAATTWVFIFRASERMQDFEVYWRAGARAAAAEPLYRPEDGHFVFKYLPAFAVLAAPIGLLPLPAAKPMWFAASVLLLIALLRMAHGLPDEKRKPAWALAAIAVVVLGKFYGHELVLGQVNLLLAVVATGALVAIRAGREALAGALFALAIVIKPYAALFLPWLIARRRPPSVAAALGGLGAALVVPAVIYGWDGNLVQHRAWWEMATSTTAPNQFVVDNVSLASAFARIVGPGDAAQRLTAAVSLALLAVAGAAFLLRRGLPFPEGLEGAILLTLVPLLSPQGWDYVFLLSTPAVIYLANYGERLPGVVRVLTIGALAGIGLSLYDVMGRAAYHAFMKASMITWLYLVVIFALLTLRVRKIA
jgi:hypothetical protein